MKQFTIFIFLFFIVSNSYGLLGGVPFQITFLEGNGRLAAYNEKSTLFFNENITDTPLVILGYRFQYFKDTDSVKTRPVMLTFDDKNRLNVYGLPFSDSHHNKPNTYIKRSPLKRAERIQLDNNANLPPFLSVAKDIFALRDVSAFILSLTYGSKDQLVIYVREFLSTYLVDSETNPSNMRAKLLENLQNYFQSRPSYFFFQHTSYTEHYYYWTW